MTLATPTTEPSDTAREHLSQAVAIIDTLPTPDALALIRDVRSLCAATESRVLGRQLDTGTSPHVIRQTIKETTGSSNRDSAQAVRRAEAMRDLPGVIAQLEAGELSTGQMDLIVKAVNETSSEAVRHSDIVDQIKEQTVDKGGRVVKDWIIDQQDPDALRTRHEKMRARREAGFYTDSSGMIGLRGLFPPLVGMELKAAVARETRRLYESEGGRDVPDDKHPTSKAQRTADALANLLLGRAKAGSAPGRPAIVVTITADRLAGMDDAPPGELLGSGPLPDEAVEELAERSDVLGLVFAGDGQPLWLGRKKRLATDAQFVAAMARDRGCVSCGEPHDELTVHHAIPFSAPTEGHTDIDNLAVLGVGCHTQVHANHQRLVWESGGKRWGSRLARPEERAKPRAREGPRPKEIRPHKETPRTEEETQRSRPD